MQIENNIKDMCNCFKAWGENTLQSKYDQLIWVEAEKRFALLGRDYIDFKISKDWNSGFFSRGIHLLSESALALTKKVSSFINKPIRSDVIDKISEKTKEYKDTINQISPEDISKEIPDLEELNKSTYSFFEGLKNIYNYSKDNPNQTDFSKEYKLSYISAIESLLRLNIDVYKTRTAEYEKQIDQIELESPDLSKI